MAPQETHKKGALTIKQLAAHDDMLTDALVDHVYYWTTIRKNNQYYKAERQLKDIDVVKIIKECLVLLDDMDSAMKRVEALSGIQKYMKGLRNERAKEHFREHMEKYIQIYKPDAPFEVTTTNRYTIYEHEAAVTARRRIRKGETIKYLCGIQVAITPQEEAELDLKRRNFSIVFSSRKKTQSLFLGPARFANHDCDPNSRLSPTSSNLMEIVARRPIEIDEEITVSYGDDYFGEDNCDCLCATCEKAARNGWAQGDGQSRSPTASQSTEPDNARLTRKRKSQSSSVLDTPDLPARENKRQKLSAETIASSSSDAVAGAESDSTEPAVQTPAEEFTPATSVPSPTVKPQHEEPALEEINELTELDTQRQIEVRTEIDVLTSIEVAPPKKRAKKTIIQPEQPRTHRVPGDYLNHKSLFSKPASKQVVCESCDNKFVQENAYEQQAYCPRCQKHIKLYGFRWPKSERDGPDDVEMRVVDDREISMTVKAPSKRKRSAEDDDQTTDTQAPAPKRSKKANEKPPVKGGIWKGWKPLEQRWKDDVKSHKKEAKKVTKKEVKKALKVTKKSRATKKKVKTTVTKTVVTTTTQTTVMQTASPAPEAETAPLSSS